MSGRRRIWVAVAAVCALLAAVLALAVGSQPGEGGRDAAPGSNAQPSRSGDSQATTPGVQAGPGAPLDDRLTWAPPDTAGFTRVTVDEPGTMRLDDDTDYVVESSEVIEGPVILRGGRHVVWVGGHIRIDDQGPQAAPTERRALVVQDGEEPVDGRIVHLEGMLMNGSDISEGLNTNAPSAVVQLQNSRIVGVHFRSEDDLEGEGNYDAPNHPDVVQTWGSVGELRIDGLTGSSAYQGLFLKADQNRPHGPVWLRRVDLTAITYRSEAGQDFYGHRLLFWDEEGTGQIRLDEATVWIDHDPRSQWGPDLGDNVHYPASAPEPFAAETGRDEVGSFVTWDTGAELATGTPAVQNFREDGSGRVYGGSPAGGEYVPEDVPGPGYSSPGYRTPAPREGGRP